MPFTKPLVNGVFLLDKPAGLSSNIALQRARKAFGRPKAGHTGTLDPLATGLLPICFGEATKYSQFLLDADKTYDATLTLGFTSSTGDAEGQLQVSGRPQVSEPQLRRVLDDFVGPIQQLPPMHSALKKNGRPLYAYARAGLEVEREPRNIVIKSIQLYEFKDTELSIEVTCSKGTYIRVLAEDIGRALGCGAFLANLRRTRIGKFAVQDATTLDTLTELDVARLAALLLPVDTLLEGFPRLFLTDDAAARIANGVPVLESGGLCGKVRLYGPDGHFLGLGEAREDGVVSPLRLLADRSGLR
ncbi:MAG: tRNA pseudouridine(55) synthase TruB [Burkholderiales bacterium]